MSYRTALLALSLSACGASNKAEPAQVEIEWPDAAVQHSGPATALEAAALDAGVPDSTLPSPDAP
ncbi:MAG: hypothetical protein JKY56_18080 [Kofleriaceae bacterium]|nr:hypothetical protein [Kofleriaceae bacterium]